MLGNGILTQEEGSQALYTWQATATTTPTALASQACNEALVQNDPASSVDVLIGNSSNQYIDLAPGDSISLAVSNANLVYHKSVSSTATLNVLARS
jgi:hypothetical protein